MQETVRKTNETREKSLFASYLEVLEAKESQAEVERQLHDEKYLRRTHKIYQFHERQRREAAELRRCLDYVSQHAHLLESLLRGAAAGSEGGDGVPLSAALVRQAAPLQRCMQQCVANAADIRRLLSAAHRPQMDNMLAKMEAELSAWTGFMQRAADAAFNSDVLVDNLHNMIAEQRRCVREVASSSVFTSMCEAESGAAGGAGSGAGSGAPAGSAESPLDAPSPSAVCSTPIARD